MFIAADLADLIALSQRTNSKVDILGRSTPDRSPPMSKAAYNFFTAPACALSIASHSLGNHRNVPPDLKS